MKNKTERKALYLAELLMRNGSRDINGVTYYYLETKHHLIYNGGRGFGMKKTIKHKRKTRAARLKELFQLILKDIEWESSFKSNHFKEAV